MFTWTYDAHTGVYKNHALSNKLMEVAALTFKFVPFTHKVDGFGKGKGETVDLVHYKPLDLPDSAELSESENIPLSELEMSGTQITVKEWGRAVEVSYKSTMLSKFDPKNVVQKLLTEQMQRVMDQAAAAAFKTAKVCFIPTSATAATWDTDGTPSTAATANLNLTHMGMVRDYMTSDLHVPFYTGDHYIGLLTTKALRGIKSDDDFQSWNQYLQKGDVIFKSEVGMAESIRCVEVTQSECLTNGVGTSSVLGEALIFGDEAVGRAEADYPHLRYQNNMAVNGADFGRKQGVAWYGLVGFGLDWPTANDREARVIRVTSS